MNLRLRDGLLAESATAWRNRYAIFGGKILGDAANFRIVGFTTTIWLRSGCLP